MPLYLTELAPSLRNNLGILNQLAMVLGLILAQSLSLFFSKQYAWRYVLAVATALAAGLLGMSLFFADGKPEDWKPVQDDESRPLLGSAIVQADRDARVEHLSISQALTSDKEEIRSGCECMLMICR